MISYPVLKVNLLASVLSLTKDMKVIWTLLKCPLKMKDI